MSGQSSSAKTTTPSRKDAFVLNSFPIPKFHVKTEENLNKQVMPDADRIYIVRTLATIVMTYVQRPSKQQCAVVARSFLQKYLFLLDDSDVEVSKRNMEMTCI